MTNLNELVMDFGDWFLTFHDEDYRTWFGSQTRKTIENEILEFLESNHEGIYSEHQELSKQIYRKLSEISGIKELSKIPGIKKIKELRMKNKKQTFSVNFQEFIENSVSCSFRTLTVNSEHQEIFGDWRKGKFIGYIDDSHSTGMVYCEDDGKHYNVQMCNQVIIDPIKTN